MKRKMHAKSFVRTMKPLGLSGLSAAVFISIACIMLVLSTLRPQLFSQVRTQATDIFYPVIEVIAKPVQGAAVFVRDVSGLAEIQAQNARLEDENARLREWYQMALLLQAENKSLRELMSLKLPPKHSYITGKVISDSGHAFVKSLLVAAGSDDGVERGMAVLGQDGLIGRIVEVGHNTSRILLVTDRNSRVPVLVENTQQHAILAGENEGNPVINRISNDVDMSIGARIITSGRGGIFPYGLPIGRVFLNENGEKRVKLNADMNSLVFVRIVKKPVDENLRLGIVE